MIVLTNILKYRPEIYPFGKRQEWELFTGIQPVPFKSANHGI